MTTGPVLDSVVTESGLTIEIAVREITITFPEVGCGFPDDLIIIIESWQVLKLMYRKCEHKHVF